MADTIFVVLKEDKPMRNLSKILFAAVLLATALLSAPTKASATITNPWCNQCAATGDCVACCRCDGLTIAYCARICSQ